METSCENCNKDYDRMESQCAYCVVNNEKRVNHFKAIKPLIHEIDFGGIEIHNLDALMAEGWSWSVEQVQNSKNFELKIYLHDITLTEMGEYLGEYEEIKQRVIKNYNLPVGLC